MVRSPGSARLSRPLTHRRKVALSPPPSSSSSLPRAWRAAELEPRGEQPAPPSPLGDPRAGGGSAAGASRTAAQTFPTVCGHRPESPARRGGGARSADRYVASCPEPCACGIPVLGGPEGGGEGRRASPLHPGWREARRWGGGGGCAGNTPNGIAAGRRRCRSRGTRRYPATDLGGQPAACFDGGRCPQASLSLSPVPEARERGSRGRDGQRRGAVGRSLPAPSAALARGPRRCRSEGCSAPRVWGRTRWVAVAQFPQVPVRLRSRRGG